MAKGPTPIRAVRIPDEEYLPAQEIAALKGETLTDVIRRAIRAYNKRNANLRRT